MQTCMYEYSKTLHPQVLFMLKTAVLEMVDH